ncbi:L-rhamnose-binding lectin CSL3-like [Mya arenaria]|uniref:L-rhamnose-binding lectin CSL3-like n=1 Tax=Mya arenaria TaxID=6604 RepID=UPI0022E6BA56|nr:L-rhamnose-binding lectin CSL3-like [Mya arenaria]
MTTIVSGDVILCEGAIGYLNCPPGRRLVIYAANYGRTRANICPDPSNQNTACISSTTLQKVKTMCQDRRRCQVQAKNEMFGDTCVGTNKYLTVEYECW